MKKWKVFLLAGLLVLTSISIFAWSKDRKGMKPYQEVAVLSLANRFFDAACYEPKKILDIFEGTFVPQSMLNKASDYLDNLLIVQGECFGYQREQLQDDLNYELSTLTTNLLRAGVGTEFAISDFYDCLYVAEESFTDLPNATKEIFSCIDQHLDIRGILSEVFKKPEPYYPHYPDEPPYVSPPKPPYVYPPVEEVSPPDYSVTPIEE